MTSDRIKLVNENGRIVGKDPETGETIPIEFESISTEDSQTAHAKVGRTQVFGRGLDEFAAGRVATAQWASWSMRIGQAIASFPVNKTKPVLIFHSEGGRPEEYEETFPRMRDRHIPWEFGIGDSTSFHDELGTFDHIDPEQAREIMVHGAEVGLYTGEIAEIPEELSEWALEDESWGDGDTPGGLDADRDGGSLDKLVRILQGQKRHIEEQVGANVSFMTARDGTTINIGELDTAKSYAIRSLFRASGHGFQPAIGNEGSDGFNIVHPHSPSSFHLEQAANRGEVADAKRVIDKLAASDGGRGLFFFHSHAVEDWRNWEAIVDYAVQKRDRGELDIASPTGGLLIPWDLPEGNVVMEPSPRFRTFDESFWIGFGNAPGVETATGTHQYWVMGSALGGGGFGGLRLRGVSARLRPFPTFMAQADVRAPPGTTASIAIRHDLRGLDTFPDDGKWSVDAEFSGVGDSWETIRTPFGIPRADVGDPDGNSLDELVFWTDDARAHIKNIKVYPC